MHYNPDSPANIIPVDICINAIIVSTWERGLANESQTVEVRNIVSFTSQKCDSKVAQFQFYH